jgi:hypothetical protein
VTTPKNRISVERIFELLICDHINGVLTWKPRRFLRNAGKPAGCIYPDGYVVVSIGKVRVPAHRIVWALHHGEWPAGMLDHINGVRSDNRLCNLRECTDSQNQMNRQPRNGLKGITLLPSGKWQAQIKLSRRSRYLGCFADMKLAVAAYNAAAKRYFGDFACLSPVTHTALHEGA